ncbi:MAG TPA: M28 family metallopeptidase [Terriglobales bacterium]|nr:M28 family metallopeptidase [Terriglobales bacterium]
MRVNPRLVLCSLLLLVPLASGQNSDFPPQQLLDRIRPEGIRAHMAFLSDDLLEGRRTGTRGFQIAAKYIAAQFQEMGLKPAGVNGTYFQNVPFRQIELVRDQSSVTLTQDGVKQKLVIGQDCVLRGDPLNPDTRVEAPVVFVGFGVTAPEFNYDDYAGVDVRGKIVAAFYGAPPRFPSAPGAHYSSAEEKLKNAAAHGAIGFLTIWAGRQEERTPFSLLVRFFRQPALRWLDGKGVPNDAQPEIRGTAMLSSMVAAPMFRGSGKTWDEALAAALDSQPQSAPLKVTASIHIVSRYSQVESPNIAAILPGSDPQLKNQYVVYSAHADHLGIGVPVNGDDIYNGAVDNASGTAALLEIARALSELPTAPRRSILFLAVTGEEEGLLGSDYFAHYPTVPISRIAANVNMDEISLFYDFRDIVALGAEHSSLGEVVDDVARHMNLEVSPDPAPEEVYFVRSDQYSFVKEGVPAVYIGEGYKTVDPKLDGGKIAHNWEATRYHLPDDDMNQPLDFNAAVKCTRANLAVGYEVAQERQRPRWNAGDFFEKLSRAAVAGGR